MLLRVQKRITCSCNINLFVITKQWCRVLAVAVLSCVNVRKKFTEPTPLNVYMPATRLSRIGPRHVAREAGGLNHGEGETFQTRPERPWGLSCLLYVGYRLSFPGIKRLGLYAEHSPPSSAEVEYYMYYNCILSEILFLILHLPAITYKWQEQRPRTCIPVSWDP